jgi:hypothetical protein
MTFVGFLINGVVDITAVCKGRVILKHCPHTIRVDEQRQTEGKKNLIRISGKSLDWNWLF